MNATLEKTEKVLTINECNECFAVPGVTIIDVLNPLTGLTVCFGRSLADCQAEYPGAIKMTVDAFCASKAAKQDSAVTWEETTEERWEDMLNVLPPACWPECGGAFLVGEPWDHHAVTGQPRYAAYRRQNGKFFTSSRPMAKLEFLQALQIPLAA